MSIDVEGHLRAVTRTVAYVEREGKPANAVTVSRAIAAAPADVWAAITSPESFARWFTPVSGELSLGGRFQFQGNAAGSVLACDPGAHIEATWEFAGGLDWVTVDLAPEDGGTRVTLTHTALMSDFWDQFGPGAVGVGWEMASMGLTLHLVHPEEPIPDLEVWSPSPEGVAYFSSSSEGWRQASVAAGTAADAAEAAAQRTTAFYTGIPDPEGEA